MALWRLLWTNSDGLRCTSWATGDSEDEARKEHAREHGADVVSVERVDEVHPDTGAMLKRSE